MVSKAERLNAAIGRDVRKRYTFQKRTNGFKNNIRRNQGNIVQPAWKRQKITLSKNVANVEALPQSHLGA